MKILISGSAGQLGRELKRSLAGLGEVVATDRRQFDLADGPSIQRTLDAVAPDVIVNAAAYTAVDKAETDGDLAHAINAVAPGIIADWVKKRGARLVHYSTDYVFDGLKSGAYGESDPPAPQSVYGHSKLAGEQAIIASDARYLIFRTSWVFGLHGANFMKTMLRLAKERDELRVICDQFGAPTWTRHLADATLLALAHNDAPSGLYHLAGGGETSWHDYAEAIIAEAVRIGILDRAPAVQRIVAAEYPLPAARPANSRLDCSRAARDLGIVLPDWRIALTDCLADARF